MKETDWAKIIATKLENELKGFSVEAGKWLNYANEIVEYGKDSPKYNEMSYQTDILIYEVLGANSWKPRVVIEKKSIAFLHVIPSHIVKKQHHTKMNKIAITVGLLVCSNFFMTFAWYAHLKELNNKPWLIAAFISW